MTHAPGAEARMVKFAIHWAEILRPLSSLDAAERILASLGGCFAASETLHQEDVEKLAGALLGVVLDPFAGSGTTAVAALAAGRDCILVEREPAYLADIRERLAFYEGGGMHSTQAKHRHRTVDHGPLFAPPFDAEADAIGSYNDAVRAVGDAVKAGAPVPDFFRSMGNGADD